MCTDKPMDPSALKTLFHECRQCGACCKSYRKIALFPDEVDFIRKMGGYVGVKVSMEDLRQRPLKAIAEEAENGSERYMIHPDDRGCVFLQKRNDKHFCRIYHHRPRTCRRFRCNMADTTFFDIFGRDATWLLGMDSYGMPLKPS